MTIPLLVRHRGGATTADYVCPPDYEGLPASVTFGVGKSEAAFDMRACPDRMIEPGEGLRINFGELPAGIVNGGLGRYETVAFVDGLVPILATVDGATLVLTYDKVLSTASSPSASDFTVSVAEQGVTVVAVLVDGSVVTLTLATAVQAGQLVTVAYEQGDNLYDRVGNQAVSFDPWMVRTPAVPPTMTVVPPDDGGAPPDDGGAPPDDGGGVPPDDGGGVPPDDGGGVPPDDGGAPPDDGGAPPGGGGAPPDDGGAPTATLPGAPESLVATAGDSEVVLEWTAPADDGGSPVTGYEYRYAAEDGVPDGTPWQDAGTELATTVTELENETPYAFEVRARNRVGPGATAVATATPIRLEAELFSTAAGATEGEPLVIGLRRSGGVAHAAHGYIGVTDSAVPEATATAEGRSDGLGRHRLEFATGATEATVTVIPAFDGERGAGRVITATLESVDVEIGGAVRAYELVTAALEFPVTDADAVLSVSDARADAESAALVFSVRLDRTRDVSVRVDYATEDGTARAGEDYTAVSGTFVIEAGGRTATVTVPLLTASHLTGERLMGERTLVLRLSNARNARLENGTATGTIRTSDPVLQAWLSRFGRTVGTHVVDAVGTRLRGAPGMESHVTVGGYRLPLKKSPAGEPAATTPEGGSERALAARLWGPLPGGTSPGAEPDGRLAALVTGLAGVLGVGRAPAGGADAAGSWADPPAGDPRLGPSQSLHVPALRQVLVGSSFRLNLGDDLRDSATPRLTAWGQVAGTTFDGRDGALTLSGDVLTGTLGVDGEWARWLAGVAVSHSRGDGSSTSAGTGGDRELENALTSIHPYLRYAVNERLDVWGVLGYGWGDVTLQPDPGATLETGTTLMMGAFGGRGLLLAAADTGGFQLATRTDAMLTRMTSDAVAGLQASEAEAHRLRLVLEGTRDVTWPDGRRLTPAVEIGLRHDWGDAETGFGLELGGRVQYADPSHGLTIEAAVRGLLAHEDSDYKEWGASGTIRIAPDPNGQGLSLTLAPTWGAASSGIESLWSRQTTAGLAPQGTRSAPTGRLNAEVSYGVAAPFGTGLLTPYVGTVLTDGAARTYRVGTRLELTGGWTPGVTLSLEGQRQEPVGSQPVNQGLQFQAALGF